MPPSEDSDYVTVEGDIASPDTAEQVVAQALQRFGRIDTLVNNAGIYIGKAFTDYTVEDYAAITSVNLAGFFHITQRAIRQMEGQGGGHVVNISTSLVDDADRDRPSALAVLTKGGLAAVARSLAIEYTSRGVRVNAVSLGVVQTPMNDPESYAALAKVHPLGRIGQVKDVVEGILVPRARNFRHRRESCTSMEVSPPVTEMPVTEVPVTETPVPGERATSTMTVLVQLPAAWDRPWPLRRL